MLYSLFSRLLELDLEALAHIYPTGTQRINWLGDLVFADSRDLRIPIDRPKLVGI